MDEPNQGEKLTQAEFVKKAIVKLRKEPYKGIHTIYSGFNDAFSAPTSTTTPSNGPPSSPRTG